MKEQVLYQGSNSYRKIDQIIRQHKWDQIFLICGHSYDSMFIREFIESLDCQCIIFQDFQPNPTYESVIKAFELYQSKQCSGILTIGGGSSIDLGKCVKHFYISCSENLVQSDDKIKMIAVPTTAGSGSEATQFAVFYKDGDKQSLDFEYLLPEYVILEPKLIESLPVYQMKVTLLDAFCQGIESYWSVASTIESKKFAKMAITEIIKYMDDYIAGITECIDKIQLAAYNAGRAINITRTTAPHAMSYQITSLYNISHGHAVAVCLPKVWRFMIFHLDQCADFRGIDYIVNTFREIAEFIGYFNVDKAIEWIEELLNSWGICDMPIIDSYAVELLSQSVNVNRLMNNPVKLTTEMLGQIYHEIFKKVI